MPELMPIFMETLSEGNKQLLAKCGIKGQVLCLHMACEPLHGQDGCLARQVALSLGLSVCPFVSRSLPVPLPLSRSLRPRLFDCLSLSRGTFLAGDTHVREGVCLGLAELINATTKDCSMLLWWLYTLGCVGAQCAEKPSSAGVAHDVFGTAHPRDSASSD